MNPPQVPEAISQSNPNPSGFKFQTYIHPTKVLFAKVKLPDGFILPPVAIAPSLNMPRPDKNPVRISFSPVIVYKAPFSAMRFVRRHGLT
jgi:hypothetical protein